MQRKDKTHNLKENFTYDCQDRLENAAISGGNTLSTSFWENGNIKFKSDVLETDKTYTYSSTHPNAVEKIEYSVGNISSLTQTTDYNSFNKISHIGEPNDFYDLNFTYGVDQERKKVQKFHANNTLMSTKYYTAGFEREIAGSTTKEWCYIAGGDGLAAIYIVENGTGTLHWVAKDHLGSIMALYDESGTVEEEYSYDAWGRRRNPTNWTYESIPTPTLTMRGYTGHEHLDDYSLINMNGRLYDPLLGRMLSPDNYVQDATGTQALNRYTYANNNPLKFVDPDGNNPFAIAWYAPVIVGAAIGAFTGASIQQGTGGLSGANWNPKEWGNDWWKGATVGAIAGAGVGAAVSGIAINLGANITGIYKGIGAGATTLGWDIGENALMTANINMASAWAQDKDWEATALSGVSGLIAGGIGGGIGRTYKQVNGYLDPRAIKATNYYTGALNGALDRLTNSLYNKENFIQTAGNTIFGAGEGLYSAYLFSDRTIASLKAGGHANLAGRYLSSALSQTATSIPGFGLTVASFQASYFSFIGTGAESPLAFASGFGAMGIAPPFYGSLINNYAYSTSLLYHKLYRQK